MSGGRCHPSARAHQEHAWLSLRVPQAAPAGIFPVTTLWEDVMAEITTHFTALRTIAVPVTDQDRALRFYVDTLGF